MIIVQKMRIVVLEHSTQPLSIHYARDPVDAVELLQLEQALFI
jgi:hypothetical protein